MRLRRRVFCLCAALMLLCSCTAEKKTAPQTNPMAEFTDDLGREVAVYSVDHVVSLYGSYAEAWTLAGGALVGATSDAVDERKMDLGEARVVGSVKSPDLETILALDPDFVILSADLSG